jgi:hypothetical protein
MAKGHTIHKTVSYQMTAEAARLEIEDSEAQRLTIEEVDGPSAPKVQINNLDRLVNWSNEFLGRRDNDRVYPVPINRIEQAARGSSTTVDINVDEENNRGGQPKLLVQPPPAGECGTFLYRERLQQQNGDMRKRDKV